MNDGGPQWPGRFGTSRVQAYQTAYSAAKTDTRPWRFLPFEMVATTAHVAAAMAQKVLISYPTRRINHGGDAIAGGQLKLTAALIHFEPHYRFGLVQ